MFSTKKNVLQAIALLKAHGIDHIVLSPGSRNAPLTHSFSQDPFFHCFSIVDERSAGYFALGLIDNLQRPVAFCCTSGTALLNDAPAVAEAFYRELPLIVLSADRSPAWIDQMDGQTIPQWGAYGKLVRKSVQLPEIHTEEDSWYCNRLLNEALMECQRKGAGPVHINIPISEPLFDFSEKSLPEVRIMKSHTATRLDTMSGFSERWNGFHKRMIVVGQMVADDNLTELLEALAYRKDCVVLCEHLSNTVSQTFIGNFDAILSDCHQAEELVPDLLITLGGHIVSKRLKKFIRTHQPKNHWHISPSGQVADTYQCLTDLIETKPVGFFQDLQTHDGQNKEFVHAWEKASASIHHPGKELPFSDITVVGQVLKVLPTDCSLYVGNSSSVRNIQHYPLPARLKVFCNRGTNGIEGSISSASGYAAIDKGLTFLMLGDLSFFYDLNGLWNKYLTGNFRILLLNNGGGGIFHLLPGLNRSDALAPFIAASHDCSAEKWVEAAGFTYLKASNESELRKMLPEWVHSDSSKPMVLEIFTTPDQNMSASNMYYQQLKNRK